MTQLSPLRYRLDGIRKVLLAHHSAGSKMPSATKGSEREVLVREFLSKVFPAPYRFGSGAIVDSSGAISGQVDVVVEFPFLPSFPTPGAPDRLYLADSVGAVIEVKSNLQSQWKQVRQTTAHVRGLRRNWCAHGAFDSKGVNSEFGASTSRVPLIAVGYKGPPTAERLRVMLDQCPDDERPDALLVVSSGAYSGCNLCASTQAAIGASGLLSFSNDLAWLIRNVTWAAPAIGPYLQHL